MTERRSYGDRCGIARALDAVGERWTLLVVRELLLGPKRFTDLQHGLPGLSPNVLTKRLQELEQDDIVRRHRLPPPAASWVYELTERGAALEPVLIALGRWGRQLPLPEVAAFSPDALLVAMKTTFDPDRASDLRVTVNVRLDDAEFQVGVADGRLEVARGSALNPDASLGADVATLRDLVFGGRRLADAVSAGEVSFEGNATLVQALLETMGPPL